MFKFIICLIIYLVGIQNAENNINSNQLMSLQQIPHKLGVSPQSLFHGVILTVAWLGCQLNAIWSLLFRNRSRYAIYVHAASMGIMLILTSLGVSSIITYKGLQVITKNWYHTMLGLAVVCLAPIVTLSGSVAKYKEGSALTQYHNLDRFKTLHILSGWILIAASRIVMYTEWAVRFSNVCLILMIVDCLIHALYFYCKVYQTRMESVSVYHRKLEAKKITWMRQIKNEQDLNMYNGDYFIFADYVYKLTPLLTAHPGGFQVINRARGRQVDRFIYGMEPLQMLSPFPSVSHSAKSILLAGLPLAQIEVPNIYATMEEINRAKVARINFYQSSKKIYTVYLKSLEKNCPFKYRGYTDVSQLGKYFAVTIKGAKTRLYTMVNFLQRKNVSLVQSVTKGEVFDKAEKQMLKQHLISFGEGDHYRSIVNWAQGLKEDEKQDEKKILPQQIKTNQQFNIQYEDITNQTEPNEHSDYSKTIKKNVIPLLVKKYDDGQFTPAFLSTSSPTEILISRPRGRGLALQDILNDQNPNHVIMFAGGTGIYPYADTIDLLFKSLLIQQENIYSDLIMKLDPILKENPFKGFQFTLYISVVTVEQMHPITLFQCQFLALHNRIKAYIKSQRGEDKQIIQRRYPHIVVNQQRFQKILWQLKPNQISRVYICGPTRMTKALLSQLQRMCWNPHKYLVL